MLVSFIKQREAGGEEVKWRGLQDISQPLGGDVLISSLLQPFTGGQDQQVSLSWTKLLEFNFQVEGQGSPWQAIMYAYYYRKHPFSDLESIL